MAEPPRRAARPVTSALLKWAAVAGALASLAACRPAPPAPRPPTPVEERAAAWRADPALPRGAPEPLLAAAATDLGADLPASTRTAAAAARAVLVQDPSRLEAVALLVTAFADGAGAVPEGEGLKEAHALLTWALSVAPSRPDLLAAQARLLLLVPSERNRAEALAAARRASTSTPTPTSTSTSTSTPTSTSAVADLPLPSGERAGERGTVAPVPPTTTPASSAALALGLALAPAEAAATLEAALQAWPADLRLRTAAARARWAAGDAEAALAHATLRLARDPGHPAMLELAAEVEAASGRTAAAAARLLGWRALDARAARPALLLARLSAQVERRPDQALQRLDEAAALAEDPYLLAEVETLRAALASAAGDEATAAAAVARALEKVPASAPAQHQAALLAFRRRDRAALREAATVVGSRCGPVVQARLAALQAELGSSTLDEAAEAFRAWAAASPREPGVALVAGASVARLGLTGPALKLARQALSLDPAEGRLRLQPVACWEGPAALFDAIGRYDEIGRSEPEAAGVAQLAAAACALELGLQQPAERQAGRVLARDPRAGGAKVLLAQLALDRGKPAEALRLAGSAQGQPGGGAAPALVARALEAAGKLPEAARAWALAASEEEALGVAGASARLGQARLQARLGQTAEASALARRLLADDPGLAVARGLLLDLAGQAGGR